MPTRMPWQRGRRVPARKSTDRGACQGRELRRLAHGSEPAPRAARESRGAVGRDAGEVGGERALQAPEVAQHL
jgi:hypothetical protein